MKKEEVEKQIGKITDTGIQKILRRHLEANGGDYKKAFSPDGVDEMNRNIRQLNNGKAHQPIYKVRVFEKADKFAVGVRGNKAAKFVEAAKGTNLFFAVYQKEVKDSATGGTTMKRVFDTVPLKIVIDRLKQGLTPAPEEKEGAKLLFVLSPNDLVYLPTASERESGTIQQPLDRKRIYKVVSCTGSRLYGIPYNIANSIIDKYEFTQLNKVEFTDNKESIKEICVPIRVDRLGNIIEINNKKL